MRCDVAMNVAFVSRSLLCIGTVSRADRRSAPLLRSRAIAFFIFISSAHYLRTANAAASICEIHLPKDFPVEARGLFSQELNVAPAEKKERTFGKISRPLCWKFRETKPARRIADEEEGRGLLRLIMIAVFRVTRRSIIVVQLPRMRNTRASVFRPPAPRINNHARLMTGDFFPSFFSFAHATNRRRCLRGVIRSRKNIYRKYLLRAL